MTNKKEKTGIHAGVDVGKFQLDIFLWERDKHFTVSNDESGVREALKVLARYSIARIAIEATGRYEMAFVSAAFEKGLPVAIVRPVLVRQFARAADQLAKTDKLDAKIIARFAAVMNPRVTPQKSKNLQLIKDLVVRRRQLIDMRTQEMNRCKVMGKPLDRSCQRIIKALNKDIDWVEGKLTAAVDEESAGASGNNYWKRLPVSATLSFGAG